MQQAPGSTNGAVLKTTQVWQGPLPAPSDLERYNTAFPGGAERVFQMAEAEQRARIEYEAKALDGMLNDTRRGHYLGAAVSFAALVAALVAVQLGASPSVSWALVGVPVLGMVQALATGWKQRQE